MDVEIEQPHLAHEHLVHQHGKRHWTDYAIPVSALFVSLISILIAWQHGEVMRQLVEQNAKLVSANSLPYLQLYQSDVGPNGESRFALITSNQGVGPAEIRTAELLLDGRPYANAEAMLAACCGTGPHSFGMSSLSGRMLRPGEVAPYLTVAGDAGKEPTVAALKQATAQKRIETRLCFCSVFNECWTINSEHLSRPARVAQCPPIKVMYN